MPLYQAIILKCYYLASLFFKHIHAVSLFLEVGALSPVCKAAYSIPDASILLPAFEVDYQLPKSCSVPCWRNLHRMCAHILPFSSSNDQSMNRHHIEQTFIQGSLALFGTVSAWRTVANSVTLSQAPRLVEHAPPATD
eukprot:1161576-Pelagomonas_calceolata.AAC.6